ncbi:MAG: hypothetical protein CM15mP107_0410 [Bacteroidota bacterium]|nr:MAG: hypothetical protein CM15mP107_0410 [Bacteroidota bacterium]
MIFRHPHIYGDIEVQNEEEVKQNWEKLKLKEKGDVISVLEGVPNALPALVKATRIQDKVRGVGFDWPNKKLVWSKLLEELEELEVEVERHNTQEMQAEYGDVLFSLVNYARHLNINPEDALERTNKKFIARFQAMEHLILSDKKLLTEMTLDEMDVYWEIAKKQMNA